MLYFFKFLFLLISIDQKFIPTGFQLEELAEREIQQIIENESNFKRYF